MNLLFLLGKFPSIGGVETVTAILANEFSARGHEVHVVSFEQVTETPSPALDSRVTLHRLGYPVSSQANLAALRDLLSSRRIDIVINQWCLPFHVTRLCRKAMRGLSCRLLAVHHNAPDCNARLEGLRMRMARAGNPVNRAFLRLLLKGCAMATGASLRYVYAHSDRYILLSDSFHRAFRNITGLKNTGKLLTIPNPVTVENREFRYDPAFRHSARSAAWNASPLRASGTRPRITNRPPCSFWPRNTRDCRSPWWRACPSAPCLFSTGASLPRMTWWTTGRTAASCRRPAGSRRGRWLTWPPS